MTKGVVKLSYTCTVEAKGIVDEAKTVRNYLKGYFRQQSEILVSYKNGFSELSITINQSKQKTKHALSNLGYKIK